MKIQNMFVILSALLMGTIVSYGQTKLQKQAEIQTVEFCELTSNPEKYINKIIRTEASYIVWWESSFLYGENCVDEAHKIHNAADCDENDGKCLRAFTLQWKKLGPQMRSKTTEIQTTSRVKAVFVGRLVGPGEYGHLSSFRYEFRIQQIEKVTAISNSVSWEGL